ncbi:MAG TPA: GNAT family N-acetyltransferase [Chthoniobacteraceae bacterium]|nr:GNAT family N-acetyltransferase [Chthoniobacteraceae bacterium]
MCSSQTDKEEAKTNEWSIRLATAWDIPALEVLIPLSVRTLQAPYYSKAQMEAALGPVFGVDRQLIRDGTYFVAETASTIVGCGGWSRRDSVYGSDMARPKGEDRPLDPSREPARIRAFFIHPDWARRGIGRAILLRCEREIMTAGFRRAVMVATMAGEPLYSRHSYREDERFDIVMKNGLKLPAVRMSKSFD